MSYKARNPLRMSLGSGGGRSVCLWRCRLLSVPWQICHVIDKYAMFSFAMTSGLASVSDKFKIIITLRLAQKFGDCRLKNLALSSLVGAEARLHGAIARFLWYTIYTWTANTTEPEVALKIRKSKYRDCVICIDKKCRMWVAYYLYYWIGKSKSRLNTAMAYL